MTDFATEQMCEALQRLQTVKSHDYAAATHAAMGGSSVLRPLSRKASAEMLEGWCLALAVHRSLTVDGALQRGAA